jgi:hypothetical protein
MSVFYQFIDRAEEYSCDGKSNELIVTTRRGKTESATVMNNDKQGLLQDNTKFTNGDLVTNIKDSKKYFIIGLQKSTEANQCQLRWCNSSVNIVKLVSEYNAAGTKTGDIEQDVYNDKPTVQWDISGNMKVYDAGLLSTTVKKFLFPICDIQLLYRIKLNGKNYKIDAINDSKYPNMYEIQVSQDTRVTK